MHPPATATALRLRHVLVMVKDPVPGRVKTRLCPPLDPAAAAAVAAAAIADTLEAVAGSSAERRIVAIDGEPGDWVPAGFEIVRQQGSSFGARLAEAWAAAGGPGLQIGMDTPQITPDLLDAGLDATSASGSAIGPAADGGWWAIGFAEGAPPGVFDGVPMSTVRTGEAQRARMAALGLAPATLPSLRDVDAAADAEAVAALVPGSRFAGAWAAGHARSGA